MLDETMKNAARMIANASTEAETAAKLGIPAETVREYLADPAFSAEVAAQQTAAESASTEAVKREARAAFGIGEEAS